MKKWIDQRGVQDEYGIPTDTMDKLRARGDAPPWFRVGRKVYFDRVQLCRWVREQEARATGKGPEAQPAKPALDSTLLNTLALDEETRERIARLIGGAANETR